MAEVVPILAAHFDRALVLDELDKAQSLLTHWSGHQGAERSPSFRLAQARLHRAFGRKSDSKRVAQELLAEGLQPQDRGFWGACFLAGLESGVGEFADVLELPFWLEVERHRWHTLSPKPDLLIERAEAMADDTMIAYSWFVACESWLRLEQDGRFQEAWDHAATLLRALPAPRLLPRLELLAMIGHLRLDRDAEAWSHGQQAQANLMPDQTQLGERVSLWTSLLHLRAGRRSDAADTLRVFQPGRQKSLLLGQWASHAAIAYAAGEKTESREHLVRFSVADEQLAVGSLSALEFLLWLGDSAEAEGDEAICEAALRCALRVAGRSGLARTVAELDDRLGESPSL